MLDLAAKAKSSILYFGRCGTMGKAGFCSGKFHDADYRSPYGKLYKHCHIVRDFVLKYCVLGLHFIKKLI